MSDAPLSGMPIGEAAKYLGAHPDSVRKWASEGKIRAVRTGGDRWRFAKADLDRFIAERTNTAEEATA